MDQTFCINWIIVYNTVEHVQCLLKSKVVITHLTSEREQTYTTIRIFALETKGHSFNLRIRWRSSEISSFELIREALVFRPVLYYWTYLKIICQIQKPIFLSLLKLQIRCIDLKLSWHSEIPNYCCLCDPRGEVKFHLIDITQRRFQVSFNEKPPFMIAVLTMYSNLDLFGFLLVIFFMNWHDLITNVVLRHHLFVNIPRCILVTPLWSRKEYSIASV